MSSELVRLPSDFVEDVRKEAEERGVSLGRVITDRAGWEKRRNEESLGASPSQRGQSTPEDQAAGEARASGLQPTPTAEHEHRFDVLNGGIKKCRECGEVKK